jgi:RNA polymerase sigma-70 factor (ECF subfamily)
MTSPAEVFLARVREDRPACAPLPDSAELKHSLDVVIIPAYAAAVETWAPIQLDLDDYSRHLGRCVAVAPGDGDLLGKLATLHLSDLYVACAAGLCAPRARERFIRHFLQPIEAAVRTVGSGSTNFVEDVRQQLHERLLVPPKGELPRILQYGGRAALATWISVAARRAALELLRETEARHRRVDEVVDDDTFGIELAPELQYLKVQFRDAFKGAVSAAIAQLCARDRTILRLHRLGGLTLARIATMLSVDESTVSRWEKRAREAIVTDTSTALSKNLGIAPDDLPSLVRLVASRVDVSVARLLASTDPRLVATENPPDRAQQ